MLKLPSLPLHLTSAANSIAMANWRYTVRQILRQSKRLEDVDDLTLKKKSLALKYDSLSGKPLDQLLVEGFSLVREAPRRTVGMSHYEVQILGGIAMHYRCVVVMQTGEGKTLTATLPLYLNALTGLGSHLVTANDYLAARDAELMKKIFNVLGMTVGVVQSNTSEDDRRIAYQCDVTYSTAKEIGFDFLRDRITKRQSENSGANFISQLIQGNKEAGQFEPVQRNHHFILVDEADSILIDEARTPLIVSSQPDEITRATISLYRWCAEMETTLEHKVHYELLPASKQIELTPIGRQQVRKLPKPNLLDKTPILDIYDQMETAIYVAQNFHRDRHYVINDNEVAIVDEFTGRLAEGRKWKTGLHQAIEAKEGLEISVETNNSARITIQDLFLGYDRIAGMTGTVGNSGAELRKIYKTGVIEVPTNRPSKREKWPDRIFATEEDKWCAIVDEIKKVSESGRPVLIGTRSIDKSEELSHRLNGNQIKHDVLNARQLKFEAEIVSNAGQMNKVTVATNMAGRGTDIRVASDALELGGLHVICSELHESARIDRQLIGRCGRQGDVGSYRQFMSLEDDILKIGLDARKLKKLIRYIGNNPNRLNRLGFVFRKAQTTIENQHFQNRKHLLYREKLRRELQKEMGQDPFLDVAGAA